MESLTMNSLIIESISTNSIFQYKNNPRLHNAKQIKQIAKSINSAGFINPVLLDDKNVLIAGHGRLQAAKELGLAEVPAIRIKHLSESQIRAYRIADNKIAENSTWDEELLRVELDYFSHIDLDIDIESTGFTTPEIDILLDESSSSDKEESPPPPPSDPVTRSGDLWFLGNNRVYCGDCRDPAAVKLLLNNKRARMIITDPPYNVRIDGHARGLGKDHHSDFQMAAGKMSPEEFTQFLKEAISQLASHCVEGSLHYLFMDWRHINELLLATQDIFDSQLNLCVWAKTNGGMGSMYRSQHELVFVFKKGKAPHINNIQLGQYGRYRTNVWQHAGVNSFGAERSEALAIHPTVKPTQLIADAILDASHRQDIILDGFLGSGTTILAAERTGRVCYGLEIDPQYVDVCLTRWMVETGGMPVLETSKETYRQVARKRGISIDAENEVHHE